MGPCRSDPKKAARNRQEHLYEIDCDQSGPKAEPPFHAYGALSQLLILFGIYPIVTQVILQKGSGNFYTNATGQVPSIAGFRGLIDQDTPTDVYTRTGFDGKEYQLVFSDEFEHDGRTFYEGDDPYWTALDSHYCG